MERKGTVEDPGPVSSIDRVLVQCTLGFYLRAVSGSLLLSVIEHGSSVDVL